MILIRPFASSEQPGPVGNIHQPVPVYTLEWHTGDVESVAFSPDGATLASGSRDDTVILWDMISGERLRTLRGHEFPGGDVHTVAWSPDGERVASGSADRTVIIWDAKTGQPIMTLEGHTDEVSRVLWSPDGSILASAGDDNHIILWDGESGELLRTMEGPVVDVVNRIIDVVFSADGSLLVSASSNKTITVWDTQTGQETRTLEGPVTSIHSLALSSDGMEAIAGTDEGLYLWDLSSGESRRLFNTDLFNTVVYMAASPADGTLLAVWLDGTATLVDSRTGDIESIIELPGYARSTVGAISPNGDLLAFGHSDQTATVWAISPGG